MVPNIYVVIPAFNEGPSIAHVIRDIPRIVSEVIVVDNGSADETAEKARDAGAVVLSELRKGYGAACLKGISYLEKKASEHDVLVFLDGDYSDHPEELPLLTEPVISGKADMVIGSRVKGRLGPGALLPHQRAGNRLATTLIRLVYKQHYSDLGPFRAIRWDKLRSLDMEDQNFGWTIEMQIKAAKLGYSVAEVPVSYRKRIGKSKVSGTLYGTLMASYKILGAILKYR